MPLGDVWDQQYVRWEGKNLQNGAGGAFNHFCWLDELNMQWIELRFR